MRADAAVRDGLVRRGIGLEIFTLSWMTVEASVAVAAGSVALLAFGIDSVIEFVAAFVVLQTFRAQQTGGTDRPEQRQRRQYPGGFSSGLLTAISVYARAARARRNRR
jgi:Co/Zn/Cd efflux system component